MEVLDRKRPKASDRQQRVLNKLRQRRDADERQARAREKLATITSEDASTPRVESLPGVNDLRGEGLVIPASSTLVSQGSFEPVMPRDQAAGLVPPVDLQSEQAEEGTNIPAAFAKALGRGALNLARSGQEIASTARQFVGGDVLNENAIQAMFLQAVSESDALKAPEASERVAAEIQQEREERGTGKVERFVLDKLVRPGGVTPQAVGSLFAARVIDDITGMLSF